MTATEIQLADRVRFGLQSSVGRDLAAIDVSEVAEGNIVLDGVTRDLVIKRQVEEYVKRMDHVTEVRSNLTVDPILSLSNLP